MPRISRDINTAMEASIRGLEHKSFAEAARKEGKSQTRMRQYWQMTIDAMIDTVHGPKCFSQLDIMVIRQYRDRKLAKKRSETFKGLVCRYQEAAQKDWNGDWSGREYIRTASVTSIDSGKAA